VASTAHAAETMINKPDPPAPPVLTPHAVIHAQADPEVLAPVATRAGRLKAGHISATPCMITYTDAGGGGTGGDSEESLR
jgi:hypothetical protein